MDYSPLILNEHSFVECKRELPERQEKYIKAIVAFLNGKSTGYLFVGVDNKTKNSVKLDMDKTIEMLSNHINNHITPTAIVDILTTVYDGNIIVF